MIPAALNPSCASRPFTPRGVRSTSIRWLSVPPEMILSPPALRPDASAFAFSTIRRAYSLNSGCSASLKATAFAAIWCMNGPPCTRGNTALSIDFRCSSLHMIIAPRGPRSVLCVVVVTMSATGIGDWWTPPAMSPAICAMSAISNAPVSLAIAPKRSKSISRGYAVAPQTIIFGRYFFASSSTSS